MRRTVQHAILVTALAALAAGAAPGLAAKAPAPPTDTPPSSRFT